MVDVLVIVPQSDEYRAVHEVLTATGSSPEPLGESGLFRLASAQAEGGTSSFTIAVGYLDNMYNFTSLSVTQRLLDAHQPRYAFLVGSACGNPSKVDAFDVVLSAPFVVYLGSGRLVDGDPSPHRHITFQVAEQMKTTLSDFFQYRTERHRAWKKKFQWVLAQVAAAGLHIDLSLVTESKIKNGNIASDDYVLEWSDRDHARAYWRSTRDDVSAYDMESAGFAYACDSHRGQLQWAVIRGISDHGLKDQTKGHLEAATVAATCLEHLLRFLLRPVGSPHTGSFDPRTYDWPRLFQLLEEQESRFGIVFKGSFIKNILVGREVHASALAYAIAKGGVREYEVPAHWGPSLETAIRLDKDSDLWLEYL